MTNDSKWIYGDSAAPVSIDYDPLSPEQFNIVLVIPEGNRVGRITGQDEVLAFLREVAVRSKIIGKDEALILEPPYKFKLLPKDGMYKLRGLDDSDVHAAAVIGRKLLVQIDTFEYVDYTTEYLTDPEFNERITLEAMQKVNDYV